MHLFDVRSSALVSRNHCNLPDLDRARPSLMTSCHISVYRGEGGRREGEGREGEEGERGGREREGRERERREGEGENDNTPLML